LFINSYTNSEAQPAVVDYNLYYSSDSGDASWIWNTPSKTTTYIGLAAFRKGTGEDVHSTFANPLFLSTTTPNFRVQPTSPAVNNGTNLGATIVGTTDFAGNPRVQGSNIDIGAYEQ
jgi:hypothetical protein